MSNISKRTYDLNDRELDVQIANLKEDVDTKIETLQEKIPGLPTEGLEYELSGDGTYYTCTGIGTATDTDIVIASEINEIPVTSIDFWAFASCSSLVNAVIPNSVISIGYGAFSGCDSLTIYCECKENEIPKGWDTEWNFSNCPVVWGFANDFVGVNEKIEETKTYVDAALGDIAATLEAINSQINTFKGGE